MEIFEALKGRRSCRDFLPDPIPEQEISTILEAGCWAPSPLNLQPWRFTVVTASGFKERIYEECERCRRWALEKSGWKWLDKYSMAFLKTAPVIVCVSGDQKKSGVDAFMEEGPTGYQHACVAAVQNMCLAAYALGIGTLWFTFYDRKAMAGILGLPEGETPIALIVMGRPASRMRDVPRKPFLEKTVFLR